MKEQPVRPTNADSDNESGRISRSGTDTGISVGNESTSGGHDPIPPGGDEARPVEKNKPETPQRR